MSAPANTEPVIRCGDWRYALDGIEADCMITDPPYGERTHSWAVRTNDRRDQRAIGLRPEYAFWSPDDVGYFVATWSPRIRGWMVALTDSELAPCWRAAYEAVGRYAFAPVPCVMRGMSVRLGGDGPSSWSVFAMVARPSTREFSNWGTLDGAYTGSRSNEAGGGRGKPDWLMRAIVRDYSRPGDLIVDPLAGWGSTLSAAIGLGRKAIGAEIDPEVCAEGNRRIARGSQTELFA